MSQAILMLENQSNACKFIEHSKICRKWDIRTWADWTKLPRDKRSGTTQDSFIKLGHKPACRRCNKYTDHSMTNTRKHCKIPYNHNVKESGKVILDVHPESNQHQNLIISIGPSLSNTYQVWSLSIKPFVSYVVDRRTQTDRQTQRHTVVPDLYYR